MPHCIAKFIATVIRDERGATAIEYALIASLIAAVIVVAVGIAGQNILGLYQGIVGVF